MIAAIIVGTVAVVWVAAVVTLLVIAWRGYDPEAGATCNLDCRDLYRYGLTAPDCPAYHGTDHFITPGAQVEFSEQFDGQIGIGNEGARHGTP